MIQWKQEVRGMKTIKVSLPEKLGMEVENYVKSGWFTDEAELLRTALQEFIRHNRLKLMEQFMKEDIEWALKVKASTK
jgi:Arc/MetJ-type ribon-helix-helix transcriptional regulator